MRFLVTGANGFIGKWVMRELEKKKCSAHPFSGDVRDKSTFPQMEFNEIIHLAAFITHRQHHSADDLYDVNVQGTKNLLEVYPKAKMVYISTTDVMRDQLSEYAKTKIDAEKFVQNQIDSLIIRLPSVFGPEQRQVKLIPLLFKKYYQSEECLINNNDLREYIYVEDVARQIVADIDRSSIIAYEGFKIKNFDLEKIIRSICFNISYQSVTADEKIFFSRLKECSLSYHIKNN